MPDIEYFAYPYPNRRMDKTVVEITLTFGPADRYDIPAHTLDVRNVLISSGILSEGEVFPEQTPPDDQIGGYTSLLVQTALLFQRKAGHRVSFYSLSCYPGQNRSMALLEHVHCDVGLTAVKLAVEVVTGQRRFPAGPFQAFRKFARERLLPGDTEAIIKAARRCDIPSVRLECIPYKRQDFDELTGAECIRQNGLLMLGHGAHQHVLDGTFCLDLSANYKDLLVDRSKRQDLLRKLGVPVKKPDDRMTGAEQYQLIAVNGQVTAVVRQSDGEVFPSGIVDVSLLDHVLKLNCEVGFAPVVVTVLAANISSSTVRNDTCVLDFELAPELDRYLEDSGGQAKGLMASTADMIIDWLFHGEKHTRMPIIAITGTNGKTTTTRMINHISIQAGIATGMVCTDGVFLNDREISGGDQGTVGGHLKVLTNKAANLAVLETHHLGILRNGFAFRWCDIAVCLNVTEDHLGKHGIETVEQMAKVKQALPERARQAVVLNADDKYCLAMIESAHASLTCLVSMDSSITQLRAMVGDRQSCFCVLESVEDGEWLVIYKGDRRLPVMDAASIPATFDGTARFNISNAMHAVISAYVFGTGIETIRIAMSSFDANYETTPGRLNIFDDLPFRIIMDFAHNPDGMKEFCNFIDHQDTAGRKLVAFAAPSSRTDETIKNVARSLAGHFDFYFCKEYAPRANRKRRKVAHILEQELLESGIAKEQVVVVNYGKEVIFEIFDACEPGDLLVMLLGHVEKHQLGGYIIEYAEKHA